MGIKRPYTETKPLEVVEADLAEPGSDEILVKILAAGVCHSDLSVINGDRPRPTPVALGHEAVGHEAPGHEALGHEALGHEALSHEALGHEAHGHEALVMRPLAMRPWP